MNIKIGHLIWGISIILFLFFAYSQGTINKTYNFIFGDFIEKTHDIKNAQNTEKIEERIVEESIEGLEFGGRVN